MKKVLMVSAAMAVCAAGSAQALELKPYAGVGVGSMIMNTSVTGPASSFAQQKYLPGFFLRAGVDLNKNFAVEFRTGLSTSASKFWPANTAQMPANFTWGNKVRNFYSGFVKAQTRIDEGRIYLLGGLSTVDIESTITSSVNGSMQTTNNTAYSIGVGFDVALNKESDVGIEYLIYQMDRPMNSGLPAGNQTTYTLQGLNLLYTHHY
ncbi:MAG: outer membrane beta-barrel protein [Zetaproteobacteria bacterium]|nr:outer membrane beta-barrel protein [Zetaproteobacteria bacterium]